MDYVTALGAGHGRRSINRLRYQGVWNGWTHAPTNYLIAEMQDWSGSGGPSQKGLKTVTDSEDRFDVSAAMRAEFPPKAANMQVQGECAGLCTVAPDSPQESVSGDDLARVLD